MEEANPTPGAPPHSRGSWQDSAPTSGLPTPPGLEDPPPQCRLLLCSRPWRGLVEVRSLTHQLSSCSVCKRKPRAFSPLFEHACWPSFRQGGREGGRMTQRSSRWHTGHFCGVFGINQCAVMLIKQYFRTTALLSCWGPIHHYTETHRIWTEQAS